MLCFGAVMHIGSSSPPVVKKQAFTAHFNASQSVWLLSQRVNFGQSDINKLSKLPVLPKRLKKPPSKQSISNPCQAPPPHTWSILTLWDSCLETGHNWLKKNKTQCKYNNMYKKNLCTMIQSHLDTHPNISVAFCLFKFLTLLHKYYSRLLFIYKTYLNDVQKLSNVL